MDDGNALLAAILAQPDEDTPRLLYADWCDENGRPERAEFVRVQVRLGALDRWRPRERLLREGDTATLKRALTPEELELERRATELWEIGTDAGGFLEIPAGWGVPYWHRGFIRDTALPASDWLAHGDAILAEHPVRRVRLTTDPRDVEGWDGEFRRVVRAEDGKVIWRCDRFRGVEFEMPSPAHV